MVHLPLISAFAIATAALSLANPVQQVALNDLAPINTANKWSWTNCGWFDSQTPSIFMLKSCTGNPEDVILIEDIQVSPDPPQPGKDLTVTVKGVATSTIEEGAYADVTVKLGLIKLLVKQFDVCEEARKANATIQCPVERGAYTVTQTVALPREIPRAKFAVHVQGYTAEDDDMLCLDLNVDFMMKPFYQPSW
ncbi:hypothetical protein H0H93_005252 [Arthromyces matolae]|nr:hypothetical protein H0H93_005252 [Arthromyces matolae]